MTTILTQKKCVPCEGGAPPFGAAQIAEYLGQLQSGWEVVDEKKIARAFKFKDFKEAMGFVNRVADLAEFEGHHPDIAIHWNKVTLTLWTHAVGGLSENDFILASKIESLVASTPSG